MPQVGQIERATDIGYKGTGKYIWSACEICSKERWVHIYNGVPSYKICKSCRAKKVGRAQRGIHHPLWKGGRRKEAYGYIMVKLNPDDFFWSMAEANGYAMEHRLVMAKSLNRCLLPWETIHHKNGIRDDNRRENLELFPVNTGHNAMTRMTRYILKLELENKKLREALKGYEGSEGAMIELATAKNNGTEIIYESN